MSEVNQDSPMSTPEQQGAAATAGPQPSLATALAGNQPSASAPAPAAPSNVAAPATPQQKAAVADMQHHSVLGKLASALLGKQTQYVAGPDGTVQPVEVSEKPGSLFRHMLGGALLGMAAGSGTNSPLAGFARGATAGIQANQVADRQRYERAKDQLAETQEDQRLKDERTKTQAQLEMWNKETILHEQDMNLRTMKQIEEHDARQEHIRQQMMEHGGIDAGIPGNGEPGKGAEMQKLFNDHPDLFRPPDGYGRVITSEVDTTGVKWDAKKGYVDQGGNALDLSKRTTWHVQFVPISAMDDPVEVGADVAEMYPGVIGRVLERNKVHTLPLKNLVAVGQKEHELNRIKANDQWRADHDERMAELRTYQTQYDNAQREIDSLTHNQMFDLDLPDKDGKPGPLHAQVAELKAKQADVQKKWDEAREKAHPHSSIRKQTLRTGPPANPQTGKAVLYDPQGTPHAVDANLLDAYLKDPKYSGWHK